MAKQLKQFPKRPEAPPPPQGPRCEAIVMAYSEHERRWREERYGKEDAFRCTREAVVEIGGQRLCRLHGGHRALDMVLSGELVPAS